MELKHLRRLGTGDPSDEESRKPRKVTAPPQGTSLSTGDSILRGSIMDATILFGTPSSVPIPAYFNFTAGSSDRVGSGPNLALIVLSYAVVLSV